MRANAFSTQKAKIVGNSQDESWSQALTLVNLQIVLSLSGGDENSTLGKELIAFLTQEDHFQKENLAELALLGQKLKEKVPPEKNLSLILGLTVRNALYLVSFGGQAFLKRGEKMVEVLNGEGKTSGFLNDEDIVILGTNHFFQVISEDLVQNLDHHSPEEIAERLASLILKAEENGDCAALILKFAKNQEDQVWEEETRVEEKMTTTVVTEEHGEERSKNNYFNLSVFLNFLKSRIPKSKRPLYLAGSGEERSKKTLLTVALLIIVLLIISIVLGAVKKRQDEQSAQFNELYQSVNQKYEDGKGLLGLNDALAKEQLSQALRGMEEINAVDTWNSGQKKKIEELEKKINEDLVTASRLYKIPEPSVFWDTTLVKEGSQGKKLAIAADKMAILDIKNHLVYFLSIKTKAVKTLGIKNLTGEKSLAILGDKVYVLGEEGVVEINAKNQSSQRVINKENDWGETQFLSAYGSSLYILDKNGRIWKYAQGDSGFTSGRNYLKAEITPDFSEALGLAVDSSVWVLSGAEIVKFSLGNPESFSISGIESLGNPGAFFTNEENNKLYLWASNQRKLIVLDKSGVYQFQYELGDIGPVGDIAASEEEKKIFLLGGSKIYGLDIK
ncbi:hypothetical protein HY439_02945 [Candidatus Microgenomates bacterium]|nr:hypothetical protein [Candidatus Microgenomates bacterium]